MRATSPQTALPAASRAQRDAADLLPPSRKPAVDERLPPVAGIGLPAAVPVRPDKAAALLPPGAAAVAPSAMAGDAQIPVPSAPVRVPTALASQPADALLIAVKDAPKVIGSGDDEVEVRRLSPEEKARRRFRKSLILWTVCLLVLIAVFYFLTR